MKFNLLMGCWLAISLNAQGQGRLDNTIWQPLVKSNSQAAKLTGIRALQEFELASTLVDAMAAQQSTFVLPVPDVNGHFFSMTLRRNSVLPESLSSRYPQLYTYDASGVYQGQSIKGKFELGPKGLFGSYKIDGQRLYLQPKNESNTYQLFDPTQQTRAQFQERVLVSEDSQSDELNQLSASTARAAKIADGQIRQYTIAITNSGEYASKHGGTVASVLDELATVVNRLNQVFEVDMGVQFVLSADNDKVIFTNSSSDPFQNDNDDIDRVKTVLDDAIGNDNYDIGHVLNTDGGGLAGVGVICSSASKADGMTGLSNPSGDRFYIDLVAHEIGHQLGAHHSFNGTSGSCDGGRSSNHAYEPGSGSTIMSYAGLCGNENIPSLQSSSTADDYFHVHSIEQHHDLRSFRTCGVDIDGGNTAPEADAGADYIIPANSPFVLEGSATDADNDPLLYSWEQFDLGGSTNSAATMATDDGSRPLFRSRPPRTSSSRYFPILSDVVNSTSTKGEAMPTTERSLNFKLTVRDNQGGVAIDEMQIQTTLNAEPLQVLAPKALDTWFNQAVNTVQWDVGDTDIAPINCTQVDLWLSTNNGQGFSTLIAEGIANDGEHDVQLNVSGLTTSARLMLKCSDNIFYAVNNGAFTIVASPNRAPVAVDDHYEVDQDSTNNQFDVIANDSDVDEDAISISKVNYTGSANIVISNNSILFTPAIGVFGEDSFSYAISDPDGASASAVVTVNIIENPNVPPVANDDSYVVQQDSSNNLLDVLINDSEAISLVSVDYNGSGSVIISDNNISYTPAISFSGNDSFSYSIEDNVGTVATANVSVTVNAASVPSIPTPTPTPPSSNSSGGGSIMAWQLYLLCLLMTYRLMRRRNEIE
ncbi:M12 family metallo-peptidase [Alteromonadaceae bacterium BrNp21-10]|nr:M12 family metallo-peptidase [Alteromonadaceae bacterium BrNp21-10]